MASVVSVLMAGVACGDTSMLAIARAAAGRDQDVARWPRSTEAGHTAGAGHPPARRSRPRQERGRQG